MTEFVTILSGSGGLGKSFFACNLAYSLKKKEKKVLLVELSFSSVSHDIIMGTAPVTMYNIADALSGVCEPFEAVNATDGESLPDFVSASFTAPLTEASFPRFADSFGSYYDYIICDASSLSLAETCRVFKMKGKTVYITDDNPISIRNTALGISRVRNISENEVYLLLSKVIIDNEKDSLCVEDVIDECRAPLIGIIPFDEYSDKSMREGRLIIDYDTFSSRAVGNICERLLNNEASEFETGVASGIFKKNRFIHK